MILSDAASTVQGCVQALPLPKDEIDRGLFHWVVKRSRVAQGSQKQGSQWGEVGQSVFRVAWVLDYGNGRGDRMQT